MSFWSILLVLFCLINVLFSFYSSVMIEIISLFDWFCCCCWITLLDIYDEV